MFTAIVQLQAVVHIYLLRVPKIEYGDPSRDDIILQGVIKSLFPSDSEAILAAWAQD